MWLRSSTTSWGVRLALGHPRWSTSAPSRIYSSCCLKGNETHVIQWTCSSLYTYLKTYCWKQTLTRYLKELATSLKEFIYLVLVPQVQYMYMLNHHMGTWLGTLWWRTNLQQCHQPYRYLTAFWKKSPLWASVTPEASKIIHTVTSSHPLPVLVHHGKDTHHMTQCYMTSVWHCSFLREATPCACSFIYLILPIFCQQQINMCV